MSNVTAPISRPKIASAWLNSFDGQRHSEIIFLSAWAAHAVPGSRRGPAFHYRVSLTAWPKSPRRKTARAFRRWCRTFTRALKAGWKLTRLCLRAGAGLFSSSELVKESEFRNFVKMLGLAEHYPGVQGMGFSMRTHARRERGSDRRKRDAKGLEDFRLWPESERQEYHAIIYLEPQDQRNRAGLGFDMFTEPTRRAADGTCARYRSACCIRPSDSVSES